MWEDAHEVCRFICLLFGVPAAVRNILIIFSAVIDFLHVTSEQSNNFNTTCMDLFIKNIQNVAEMTQGLISYNNNIYVSEEG